LPLPNNLYPGKEINKLGAYLFVFLRGDKIMELAIIKVTNDSTPEKEYIWMEVLEKTNLKYFIIWDNSYNVNGEITNQNQLFFKFPAYEVAKGDRVALYTSLKLSPKEQRQKGGTTHRFNWNLTECVWNNGKDKVHLLRIAELKYIQIGNKNRAS
jgi:hypothetical protein